MGAMIRLGILLLLSLSLLPVGNAQIFPDVDEDYIYYNAIVYGVENEIITGYDDGYYRPNQTITRAEFLRILFSANKSIDQETLEGCYVPEYVFSDVPYEAWYHHYICMAYRNDVVEGYGDGTFRPGKQITAVEALKILSLEYVKEDIPKFLRSGPWYESYARAIAEQDGIPLTVESPGYNITRGEMMEMVWRLRAKNRAQESHTYESFAGETTDPSGFRQAFLDDDLKTNTALADIDLGQILDGGPGKDGIPAISNPKFISPSRASWLKDVSLGILYQSGDSARFYPYDVLYWHEIVNDTLNGTDLAVTFCPLCGSAIVYDRAVGPDTYQFGVSGKLWQSNMLMYDKETETLWSQIEGRAVVGDLLGGKLRVLPSDVVTFGEAKKVSENLQVLSRSTGHFRRYGSNPYGTYDTDSSIFFPIQNHDASFHSKELFVATTYQGVAVAFHRKDLLTKTRANISVKGKTLFARAYQNGTIEIYDRAGNIYPHYTAMWFSWANHNEGVVWNDE